jgi:hypothetical protein
MVAVTFPTPYHVLHVDKTAGGDDGLGNPTEVYTLEPKTRPVIAFAPAGSSAGVSDQNNAVDWDLDVYLPAGWLPTVGDKLVVPMPHDLEAPNVFEVVGVQDWTLGFHGWPAGGLVKLKRVGAWPIPAGS